MILAIDIGNTHTVIGVYQKDTLLFAARLATNRSHTEYQYAMEIEAVLRMHHLADAQIKTTVISCVVPPLLPMVKGAVNRLYACRIIAIGPGIKTGLNIRIDNPTTLGSDLVCSAVAAIQEYGTPCVVVDLGTATKISAIDRHGNFLGCSIMPGIGVSLNALSANTAQLPSIDIGQAGSVIGTNTPDSMRSGIIYGTAAMVDGMLERYLHVLGAEAAVVATGGYAESIIPHCKRDIPINPQLILEGLRYICNKND